MPDSSFSLGYYEFECLNKKTYHCATAQSNLFLWPLYRMTGNNLYRKYAIGCTRWMAHWAGYDERYFGSPIHDRAYNGESMMVSLSYLGKGEGKLREEVITQLKTGIVDWAVENFGRSWFKDGQMSHAKDPLLLMVLRLAEPLFGKNGRHRLSKTIREGYEILKDTMDE